MRDTPDRMEFRTCSTVPSHSAAPSGAWTATSWTGGTTRDITERDAARVLARERGSALLGSAGVAFGLVPVAVDEQDGDSQRSLELFEALIELARMDEESRGRLGARCLQEAATAVGAPGVDPEARLLADPREPGPVEDHEEEAETLLHLGLPLLENGRRRGDHDRSRLLAKQQLPGDEAGFDGLAEAGGVGDEEVHARLTRGDAGGAPASTPSTSQRRERTSTSSPTRGGRSGSTSAAWFKTGLPDGDRPDAPYCRAARNSTTSILLMTPTT